MRPTHPTVKEIAFCLTVRPVPLSLLVGSFGQKMHDQRGTMDTAGAVSHPVTQSGQSAHCGAQYAILRGLRGGRRCKHGNLLESSMNVVAPVN